jgi:hypothetical protein
MLRIQIFPAKVRATISIVWSFYRLHLINSMVTWTLFKASLRGLWSIK